MITLKIKKPGHIIEIPGLPTLRSPVDIDITKLDMRKVAIYLKTAGINQYEIISEKEITKKVYTHKDFEKKKSEKEEVIQLDIDKRFNKLEKMMLTLLTKKTSNVESEKEQITDKLDKLERLVSQRLKTGQMLKYEPGEPEIEELDSFIPDIDLSEMTIKSDIKIVKRDDDLEDSVDILSGLMKK